MADPFSITGSAVGVISLGLTICQGLLAYYGPYKSFHEEINEVASRVQSLNSLLTTLNDLLANSPTFHASPSPQPIQAAIQSIQSCSQGLHKLDKIRTKCRTSHPPGKPSRSANQLNRLLYPFRQETLVKLMGTVTWLQDNLNTSLLLLQIAMQSSESTQMDLLVAKSSSAAFDTNEIKNIATRLDVRHSNLEGTVNLLQHRLDQMESHMRASMERQLISPGSLRQLMDNQQANDGCFRSLAPSVWTQRRNRKKSPDNQAKKVLSLIYRHTVCNRFLKYTLTASLTVTKSAGGCSISPNLQFRAIVPNDSPAFSLIQATMERLKLGDCNQSIIRDTRTALFELFYTGKASLSDTLENGDTIMHAVVQWEDTDPCWEPNQWADWRVLIGDLADAGLAPNCVNDQGQTPADLIAASYSRSEGCRNSVNFAQVVDICSDLFARGSFITLDETYTSLHLIDVKVVEFFDSNTLQLIWSLADKEGAQVTSHQPPDIETEIRPILPLISRSDDQLRLLVNNGLCFSEWLPSYVEWPTGLEILLQSGYKPDNVILGHACYSGYEDLVRLILQTEGFHPGTHELESASLSGNPQFSKLVVEAVAHRRRELQLLVKKELAADKTAHLNIRPGTLLDRQAFNASQLLLEASIEIGGLCPTNQCSVYDTDNLSIQTAEQLWDAGFEDVDEVDELGYTSLMKLNGIRRFDWKPDFLLKNAAWLISKGADMHRKIPGSKHPTVLSLSHRIGKCMRDHTCWGAADTDLLYRIMVDDARDDCSCSCSIGGCSALTKLLDGIFDRVGVSFGLEKKVVVKEGYITLWRLVGLFDVSAWRDKTCFNSTVASAIIRYIAFTELELTHTCHKHGYGWEHFMSEEAIKEIHEEEGDLVQSLEELVHEFCEGYLDYPYALCEYVRNVMWPRLDNFQYEKVSGSGANDLDELAINVKLVRYPTAPPWRSDD
ncbi:hypothetical protein BJX68DRAFT_268382 [Aspergillus pseudodeflectus]|uniref:Fungal N-terminal domain-containing protein n=1 Tax=Aspergillus pseudodeflectus TaxID=176178 RepID=A0ABR4K446_9EURO